MYPAMFPGLYIALGAWRDLQRGASLPRHYKGDEIKQDEVDGTCSTHGGDHIHVHAKFESENLEGRDHMGNLRKALFRHTGVTSTVPDT
jgi:hypothetical protein